MQRDGPRDHGALADRGDDGQATLKRTYAVAHVLQPGPSLCFCGAEAWAVVAHFEGELLGILSQH